MSPEKFENISHFMQYNAQLSVSYYLFVLALDDLKEFNG